MMNLTNKEITFLEEQKDILNKVPTDWLAFFNNMSKNKTLSRVNTFRIVVFLTQNGFDIMEFRNEVFLSIMEESCNTFRGFSKIAGSDVNIVSLDAFLDKYMHNQCGVPTESVTDLINDNYFRLGARVENNNLIID